MLIWRFSFIEYFPENPKTFKVHRPFSINLYVFVIILLSWPFQIAYVILGKEYRPLLLVSMIMVGFGTFICGKFIFKDGFKDAGWSWGKPKHYFYIFLFALILWLFPAIVEQLAKWHIPAGETNAGKMLSVFLLSALITIIPAFGEEFGWRGYLLPGLLKIYAYKKALLVHGFITWVWHLPFLFAMGMEAGEYWTISIPVILTVSFIPTVLHAVVFAYIWSRTASLAVSTFYHVSFDEVRDTLIDTVGLGFFGMYWQMFLLTLVGIMLLWWGKWNLPVQRNRSRFE